MENLNIDIVTILFLSAPVTALIVFFYLFLKVRFLIKDIFRNINEISYKISLMEKNKEYTVDIQRISHKLREISRELKKLSNNIKGIDNTE